MPPITKGTFTQLINEADASKRFFPYPAFENVENVRAEPEYFTFNSNRKVRVQPGVRTFTGMITEIAGIGAVAPKMIGKIESGRCAEMGYYIVGVNGDLTGTNGGDEGCSTCGCGLSLDNTGFDCVPIQSVAYKLIAVPLYDSNGVQNKITRADGTNVYPIKIASATLNVIYIPAKDKEPAMLAVSFDFDVSEKDENLVTIPCSELGGTYLLTISGLHDVCGVVSEIEDNGCVLELKTDFGIPKTGLVAADFVSAKAGETAKIYNKTQDTDITVTVSETTTPGTYELSWTSQSPEDELILFAKDEGFDFTCLKETEVVIPIS